MRNGISSVVSVRSFPKKAETRGKIDFTGGHVLARSAGETNLQNRDGGISIQ